MNISARKYLIEGEKQTILRDAVHNGSYSQQELRKGSIKFVPLKFGLTK